jgi:MSHA biogenesis protein MshN
MKTNLLVKVLIAKSILLFSCSISAWSVGSKVIELNEPTEISSEETTKDIASIAENSEKTRHHFNKKLSKLTAKEIIDINYWRALGYLKQKDTAAAESLFISNLNQDQKHHLSRIELSALYLRNELWEEAEGFLQRGLKEDSRNPDFLRLMATLHNAKGEPEKALELLLKIKEPHVHHKAYIILLGHVYQQLGHATLARKQYFRLLQVEPNNPLWLLGVTMSLDTEGQREPALEGYRRLAKESAVEPEVLQYIRDRIAALKG